MCMKPQTMMGNIIVAIIVFSITGTLGWIAVQSANVPTLKIELQHLNKSIVSLTSLTKEQTHNIIQSEKSNTAQHQVLMKAIIDHTYKLKTLEQECEKVKQRRFE